MDPFRRPRPAPSNPEVQREQERGNQGPQIAEALALARSMFEPGDLKMSARTSDTPDGLWMVPDGRELSSSEYPEYAEAVGTAHNLPGDGPGIVRLPDYRRRTPVGVGEHATNPDIGPGSLGGEERHQLLDTEHAPHLHGNTGNASLELITNIASSTGVLLQGGGSSSVVRTISLNNFNHGHSTGSSGSGVAHNNMQPYVGQPFLIRVRP